MKRHQLRKWFYASVAVALLLSLIIAQLDNKQLYSKLQDQLAESGISLQADTLSLSWIYMGSIRLDGVHIQSETFDLDANRLFIDLNLAALLTGSALPQALYLQMADIKVSQDANHNWFTLFEDDDFKLKRIDISQSSIHFIEQNITLEQASLDIRDIGKNKNPRMELRAHIGDGRIDAHGYLHLKYGKVTRGFSRIKLYDIPLSFFKHGTILDTLNGSLTTHLNQDKSWQSFGHINLQAAQKDELELRAKVTGNSEQLFQIEDLVLNHKKAGALQVTGACDQEESCQFSVRSKKIMLSPLLALLNSQTTTTSSLKNFNIQGIWQDDSLSSSGEVSWSTLDYILNPQSKESEPIHVNAAKVNFSGLQRDESGSWLLKQLSLLSPQREQAEISISNASFQNNQLKLPLFFSQTSYWLPLAQTLASYTNNPSVQGKGHLDGETTMTLVDNELISASTNLDASQTEFTAFNMFKPEHIPLRLSGELLWQQDNLPSKAQLALQLDESTFTLHHENYLWQFENMEVDFSQLREAGITLPQAWLAWHGYIRGNITLNIPETEIMIQEAEVDLIAFGSGQHFLNGQIKKTDNLWHVKHLRWQQNENFAEIFNAKHDRFNIIAESLDAQALILLRHLPFQAQGKLTSKALHLPFGTIKDVTAMYETSDKGLALQQFKSNFYEGSLSSEQVDIFQEDETIALRGQIQVGGIHLNNWKWLHKQFDTHLEATVYATLNLHANFDIEQKLTAWKGDGDVSIYNGRWLLNGKNVLADKISLTLRKRKQFNTTFKIKDGKNRGDGKLTIDENNQLSGQLQWLDKTYLFSKAWPHIRYEEEQIVETK